MSAPVISFGTSGWRGIVADDFTFHNVRIAMTAVAGHICGHGKKPVLLVAHDTRFFSEEFARTAAVVLAEYGIRPLICIGATPTPAVAFEILRRKTDGAINFTASHNPAEYNGLKFSSSNGSPAVPEITQDIEARAAAALAASPPGGAEYPAPNAADAFERVDIKSGYLARLGELVRFDALAKASRGGILSIVYDALHGCGAGWLDGALAEHGVPVHTIRAERDVLFEGTGPDVSETNLAKLGQAVVERKARVGLATDGDADRFGIVDERGRFVSPNHLLALAYDYVVESRGWRMPAVRSVATTHLVDAVARNHGLPAPFETRVGFKYIGQLIAKDAVALGGEESSGMTIRGHVPEKDGILACLLIAEMIAARGKPLEEQLHDLFRRVGRAYWPVRANLRLPEDVKARTVERLHANFTEFLGRRVARTDRTDGLKLTFADERWVLLRISGTEPLLRIYTEAATLEEAKHMADGAREWVFAATEGANA